MTRDIFIDIFAKHDAQVILWLVKTNARWRGKHSLINGSGRLLGSSKLWPSVSSSIARRLFSLLWYPCGRCGRLRLQLGEIKSWGISRLNSNARTEVKTKTCEFRSFSGAVGDVHWILKIRWNVCKLMNWLKRWKTIRNEILLHSLQLSKANVEEPMAPQVRNMNWQVVAS